MFFLLKNKMHVLSIKITNKSLEQQATCVIKCNKHIGFMFHIFLLRCLLTFLNLIQRILGENERSLRGKLLTSLLYNRLTPTPACCYHSSCSVRMVQRQTPRGERIFPHYLCRRVCSMWCRKSRESFHFILCWTSDR